VTVVGCSVYQAWPGRPIRFDPQTFTMSWPIDQAPPRPPLIGRWKSGRLAYASDDSERLNWIGDDLLAVRPERPHLARSLDTDAEIAVIDLTLLSQVATAAPGRTRQRVRFTGHEPLSAQAAQTWKAAYAYVRDSVLMCADTEPQSLIVSSAVRLLAAITLATFPNTAITWSEVR
jgi:hypothetical protein